MVKSPLKTGRSRVFAQPGPEVVVVPTKLNIGVSILQLSHACQERIRAMALRQRRAWYLHVQAPGKVLAI